MSINNNNTMERQPRSSREFIPMKNHPHHSNYNHHDSMNHHYPPSMSLSMSGFHTPTKKNGNNNKASPSTAHYSDHSPRNMEIQKACIRDLYQLAKVHGADDGRPMPDAHTLQLRQKHKQLTLEAKLIKNQRRKHEEFERAEEELQQQNTENNHHNNSTLLPSCNPNNTSSSSKTNTSTSSPVSVMADMVPTFFNPYKETKQQQQQQQSRNKNKNRFSFETFLKVLRCEPNDWSENVIVKELKQDFCFCVSDDTTGGGTTYFRDDDMTMEDYHNYSRFQRASQRKNQQNKDLNNMILSVPSTDANVNNNNNHSMETTITKQSSLSGITTNSRKKKVVLVVGDDTNNEPNNNEYVHSTQVDQSYSSHNNQNNMSYQTTDEKDHSCSDENLDKILQMVDNTFQKQHQVSDDDRTNDISTVRARRTVEKYAQQTGMTVEELLLEVESQYTNTTSRGRSRESHLHRPQQQPTYTDNSRLSII